MTTPFIKQAAFTKKATDLPDVPSPGLTPAQIKEYFQKSSDELKDTFNNVVDKLNESRLWTEDRLADDSVSRRTIQPGAVGLTELDPAIVSQPGDGIAEQAKFASIDASLADISSKRIEEFTYNLNALRKVRSKHFFSSVAIGDSIGAGSSSTNNVGFIQQLGYALRVLENKINYDNYGFYYSSNVGTWSKEEIGICKYLLSSKTGSTNLVLFGQPWFIPATSYTVKVVYSKRPDGGTFQVGYGATPTILGTIDCNGTTQDGVISATYTVPANQDCFIIPMGGQKAYINNVIVIRNPSSSYYAYDNWSVGGRKAKDYTITDLQTMLNYLPKDLLIWELLANDYSGGDYDSYVNRTEAVMTQAKSLGMDILIPITCGNSASPSDANWRNKWVAYLYDVAKRYDAAIIDFDLFLGGYNKAYANGLIADTIHPTDQGHLLMANVLIDVLLGIKNPLANNILPTTDNSTYLTYGYKKDSNNVYYPNNVVFDNPYQKGSDNNGNKKYVPTMPNNGFSIWDAAQLPKNANTGELAYFGDSYIYGRNGSSWVKLYTEVRQPVMANLPGAQAGYRGHCVILDGGGTTDDKMYVCIKQVGGSYAWKQVTLA